jgi:hypothetical protein
MKKILVSFLLINCFAVFANFAEEKKDYGLFEEYFARKPLLSRLTGSDQGTQYIGSISENEEPSLGIIGYLNYLRMIKRCEENSLVILSHADITYVCSTDQSEVAAVIDSIKNTLIDRVEVLGKVLQLEQVTSIRADDESEDHVLIVFRNLNGAEVDSVKLGFKVLEKVKQSASGLSIIDGNLVKIVCFKDGDVINPDDILPTKEEIEQAKATISQLEN